jgi:hypothetical protein
MADADFEQDLMAMFAEPPPLGGGEAFTLLVRSRLERGWTMRRWMIGGLGAAGGVLAASQWALASFRLRGDGPLAQDWATLTRQVSEMAQAPAAAVGMPVETLYVSAALAVVALVLGVGRLVREI